MITLEIRVFTRCFDMFCFIYQLLLQYQEICTKTVTTLCLPITMNPSSSHGSTTLKGRHIHTKVGQNMNQEVPKFFLIVNTSFLIYLISV